MRCAPTDRKTRGARGTEMRLGNLARGIARGFAAFDRAVFKRESRTILEKFEPGCLLVSLAWFLVVLPILWGIDSWRTYEFNHLSATQHLAEARSACGSGNQCADTSDAIKHLQQIPPWAPEHGEASTLWNEISQQLTKGQEAAKRTADEAQQRSREQMQRNFQGEAHDSFICANSTEHQPVVSFDDGQFWWKDDGRCADRRQKRRDEDAQNYSYWSTTIRVDTDMDSFWLPDEERNCQTFPDSKGRVATVLCDATAHANHNIPVKFWGGVDRDTVSDWKCRREKDIFSDEFVCRAID